MSNVVLPRPSVLFLHKNHELARAIAFRLDLAGFTVEVLPAGHDSFRPSRPSYDAAIVQLPASHDRAVLADVQAKSLAKHIVVLAGCPAPAEGNGVAAWLTAPFSTRAIEARLRQLIEASTLHLSVPGIYAAEEGDWPVIWQLFQEVAVAGESFAYDEETPEETARELWFDPPAVPFVIEFEGNFAGTYYLRPNQPGRGDHVANAGYMIAAPYQGQGLASLMCAHSLDTARALRYRAVQFNFVVSTNTGALRVWEKFGFAIVGRVPRAFRHIKEGPVDVLILHREI